MIYPELSDIWVDDNGKLWRCIATQAEPTVTFEEVEGRVPQANFQQQQQALQYGQQNSQLNAYISPIIKDRKTGGVSAAMWDKWRCIFRSGD